MSRPVIVNQLGPRVTVRIAEMLPAAQVVEVEPGSGVPTDSDADVVLASSRYRPQLIVLCQPSVRWIHLLGAGADNLPEEAFADGRIVTSSKGASSVPISEFVLASILAFEKRFPLSWIDRAPGDIPVAVPDYGAEAARSPALRWEAPSVWGTAHFGVLPGKTLGLLGFGGIGQAVAERARAFGMKILVLRRRTALSDGDVELAQDVADLVSRSDHLVIAAPMTERTRHIINAQALSHAKPTLHLVNISRGGLVDQDALLAALDEGRIAFASLDVTDPEPLPDGHPLYTHPRVHLTPHVSWSTPYNMGPPVDLFLQNLRRYVDGEPLVGVVDPAEGY